MSNGEQFWVKGKEELVGFAVAVEKYNNISERQPFDDNLSAGR